MHKVFENSGWLLIDKLSKLFPGIIVLAMMARHLGPEQFGIWNYALALTTIAGSFALLGMDKIAVKELLGAKSNPSAIVAILIFMRIGAGIISMAVSIAFVVLSKPHQPIYLYCTIFTALTIVLQSFDVFDYFYQAQNDVKKVIIPKVVVFLIFCVIKLLIVFTNGTLSDFLWVTLAEGVVTYTVIIDNYRRRYASGWWPNLDYRLGKYLLAQGWPLLFSNLVVVLFVKIDLLLLDMLGTASQLGEYVVAARISELWYAIPVILATAILPDLINKRKTDMAAYWRGVEKCMRLSFWVSFTISLLVMLLANVIIPFLYGKQYVAASAILMIHVWASVPVFLCSMFTQYLVIEGSYKITLYGNIMGLIINVGLNMVLIRPYGGIGAAIATVIAYSAVYLSLVAFDKSGKGWLFTRKMLNPLLAYEDVKQAWHSLKFFALNYFSVTPENS
ncbi:MAG: flippase [Chitinophaga sp.]|uniref:flippase n=1 Tax=Chitinophaga sp. TaxID=1869181 RepID=UPI001B11B633|nr:flippase [Chitinophaga sp.]MBO9732235.1 flippase [Chitinophaga sp.]